MSLLTELLAKREQFITTDYAFKSNVDKNRLQLLACARLVAKQHHRFFAEAQLKAALSALQQDKSYTINQQFLLLQQLGQVAIQFHTQWKIEDLRN